MKTETIRMLRLRALALITVAGTAWISFSSSQDLAVRAGFGIRSWAFPVCLDAVAAFAVDVWMRRSPAQRPAGTLALTAIGLSLAANVADHYLITGTALAALLGGIPPVMLAWLLLVLHKHGQPAKVLTPPLTAVSGPIEPPLYTHPAPEPEVLPADPMPSWAMKDLGQTPVYVAPEPAPEPVKPLPVNVPDNDPERTQLMPKYVDEEPGKFDPSTVNHAPAKVQPARRSAPEVSTSVEPVSRAHLSDEDLIQLAMENGLTSRRAIGTAYKLGTTRAGVIARAVKEKSRG